MRKHPSPVGSRPILSPAARLHRLIREQSFSRSLLGLPDGAGFIGWAARWALTEVIGKFLRGLGVFGCHQVLRSKIR
jgi:hypothetical protein